MMYIVQTSKDSQIQLHLHHNQQTRGHATFSAAHTATSHVDIQTKTDTHDSIAARGPAIRSRDRIAVNHRDRDITDFGTNLPPINDQY